MLRKLALAAAWTAAAVIPAVAETPPLPLDEMVRRALEVELASEDKLRDYVYAETIETLKLDSDGRVKERKSETYEVTFLYGDEYWKLIARDGRPLSASERQEQERRYEKEAARRAAEAPKERAKRIKAREERQQRRRELAEETFRAFRFSLVGEERIAVGGVEGGLDAWVIAAEPRKDFRPKYRRARILKALRGTFWISKSDFGWARLEAEAIEPVSFGWLLVRLKPGARFEMQQRRLDDGLWATERLHLRFAAKIGLIAALRREIVISWSDYRKFVAESTFTAAPVEAAIETQQGGVSGATR